MTRIKIISNPYNRSLSYHIYKEQTGAWEDIHQDSINSRLRENDAEKIFLPFKVKEIIDTIVSEYYVGSEKIELIFEGTGDEYEEVVNVCNDEELRDKVHLLRSTRVLENARDILDHAKEIFGTVHPIINSIIKDDPNVTKGLEKVSDALKDIIPICIFGNYSAGKSTFINSLIGYEILPSGGDPVTSKIFEIKRSPHVDRAKIKFEYLGDPYELHFDNKECRVFVGDRQKDLVQEILAELDKLEPKDLFHMVNKSIDILNFYERRDRSVIVIGNVIHLEIPFSENGKLGQSRNEFVIFDTPGSNSNTNMDHEKVLMDSLEGFSNGIPVWVSGYDSIDSVDNAHLCDKLYQIDALDKRFTMIVINKADSVELPKNGFGKEEIKNLMEYESVEKMYSGGMYFVSAVMGLGAKNTDGILSDYLLDVFDEKERKFSDPNARNYKRLYEYNIMPEQMKQRALEYSQNCENIIYANSGLYCVEMEMEQFASKHAAYNKCQMVYIFLSSVIDETARRIQERTQILEKSKQKWEQDMDAKKFTLVENVGKNTTELVKKFEKESKPFMQNYVKETLKYEHSADEVGELDAKLVGNNEQSVNYEGFEKDYEGAKSSRWKNLLENSQNLFKGNIVDSVKNLAEEWVSDSKTMQEKKSYLDHTRQYVDKDASDKLINVVVAEFRYNIVDAQKKLGEEAKEYWHQRAQEYRNEMIKLITGSDALSESQRATLSADISNYPIFQYDDNADKVFIKAKYLRGNVLGLRIGSSERLNTSRLAASYNSRIKQCVNEMAQLINTSCFECFENWQTRLKSLIEENITTLNPELRELNQVIHDQSERILELQTNQQTISSSFKTMENMMAWRVLE